MERYSMILMQEQKYTKSLYEKIIKIKQYTTLMQFDTTFW